ncbi:MAG: hypothetical protein IPF54_24290 [Draconibacterium sp.]|nr:hypothetical protein [Draconibacterium sp.]
MGDAKGFNFYAIGKDGRLAGIMGDSISISNLKTLNAVTPLPGQVQADPQRTNNKNNRNRRLSIYSCRTS